MSTFIWLGYESTLQLVDLSTVRRFYLDEHDEHDLYRVYLEFKDGGSVPLSGWMAFEECDNMLADIREMEAFNG